MAFQNLSVNFRVPPRNLFHLSPDDAPPTILPRLQDVPAWVQPFNIHPTIFHFFLEPKVPITIAAVYVVFVVYMNRVNEMRQNKPWNFAKTSNFKAFVLCHNIFLAVFSAVVFHGLCHALWDCWPHKTQSNFLVHVADSLCRITGPTDLDAMQVSLADEDIYLQHHSSRLWNNGYAYLSWMFYISKFYEVVDTLIILAKGKKTSILQLYHHTGVMFCMWAGVRYMSPPGIVGVVLNSGIHTLMYSYYALTTLAVPVSGSVKRALTSLQIGQFIGGCIIACSYFFIEYDTIVSRTAGSRSGSPLTSDKADGMTMYPPTMPSVSEGLGYGSGPQDQIERVPCLQDSGQAFATWLCILYCLPLTYLFVRFFIRSYIKRAKGVSK